MISWRILFQIGLLVLNCVHVGYLSAGATIFGDSPFPFRILEKEDKKRVGFVTIQFWCHSGASLRPAADHPGNRNQEIRALLSDHLSLQGAHSCPWTLAFSGSSKQWVYTDIGLFLNKMVSSKVQVWNCRGNKRTRLLTFFILGHSGLAPGRGSLVLSTLTF